MATAQSLVNLYNERNNMQLTVNGEPYEFHGKTIADLVDAMALNGRRLAVEVNRNIITRSAHDQHQLHDGDIVEIVHAIGGG